MSDPLRRLFFPLTSLKLAKVFAAGELFLDLVASKAAGKSYASALCRDGKPLKLSLEKIDDDTFTQALLQHYYFRQQDKEFGAHRLLFARLGFHTKEPLQMQYAEQKYLYSFRARQLGQPLTVSLTYSPSVGRVVARANRGAE